MSSWLQAKLCFLVPDLILWSEYYRYTGELCTRPHVEKLEENFKLCYCMNQYFINVYYEAEAI